MSKNFDVLLTHEARKFIKSLDIKIQKKVAYNIQKSRDGVPHKSRDRDRIIV